MATFLYTLIIYPLYTIIECIYYFCQKLIDPVGISVIGVSVGVTLLCLPLYAVADKWQEIERNKVKAMQPQLDRIKKCFTGDERYMMTTTYYRQCHYSPVMALRSSFGLLIQIPFFIAAYRFLSHLPALNGESFLFIKDMGQPDALFTIGTFQVNILPIAMTLINLISGLIYSKGHALREKIQIFGMAAIFLVILYNSPAGLVLYWTFNNIFSLVKNIFYKLKKPIFTFWLLICAACIPALIYVLFFFVTKPAYRILFTVIVVFIYCLPLILKAINRLLDTSLLPMLKDNKGRTILYISSCLLLWVLTGFTIPTSLISSSPAEFSGIGSNPNPLGYMGITLMQSSGIFIFWALCVYFLFNKKVQTILTLVFTFGAVSAILNSFVFMLNYGDVSATLSFLNAVEFKTLSGISFFNIFVLAVIFTGIIFVFKYIKPRYVISLFAIVTISLFSFSLININTITSEYNNILAKGNLNTVEIKPIFHLSKNKPNVVVLMLDRAENRYVEEMFKEDPRLNERLSGFTLYKNTISFNGHTMMGAPLIFGGYEYSPLEVNKRKDELLYMKNNEALLMLPRILTEQADFHAAIADPSWANYSGYADLSITDPYEKIDGYQTIGKYSTAWYKRNKGNENLDNTDALLKHNLIFFSIFRSSPICLRELVYLKGKFWNTDENVTSYTKTIDNYAPLDLLPELTDYSETEEGSYVCLVNELTHDNIFMQAPDYIPANPVTNF
nr:membrane protein insertase YidC [Treponema sp.]